MVNRARFSGYALSEHFMARHAKRIGDRKLAKEIASSTRFRFHFIRSLGNATDSPESQNLLYECYWKDKGRNSIFIKDTDALANIESLKVDNFDPELVQSGAWIIAPPKASGLPAFLFSVSRYADWAETVHKWIPDLAIDSRASAVDATNFSTSFRQGVFTFHQNTDGDSIKLDNPGQTVMGGGFADSPLTEEEYELMQRCAHLGLRTLIYQMIFPDKVIDGAPNLNATTKPLTRGKSKIIGGLGGATSITAVGLHYRQLRSPRYYKGEYADKPVGTRFVKVNPYVRGSKNAKTVSEGEE